MKDSKIVRILKLIPLWKRKNQNTTRFKTNSYVKEMKKKYFKTNSFMKEKYSKYDAF